MLQRTGKVTLQFRLVRFIYLLKYRCDITHVHLQYLTLIGPHPHPLQKVHFFGLLFVAKYNFFSMFARTFFRNFNAKLVVKTSFKDCWRFRNQKNVSFSTTTETTSRKTSMSNAGIQ